MLYEFVSEQNWDFKEPKEEKQWTWKNGVQISWSHSGFHGDQSWVGYFRLGIGHAII